MTFYDNIDGVSVLVATASNDPLSPEGEAAASAQRQALAAFEQEYADLVSGLDADTMALLSRRPGLLPSAG